jgi:hypothetical protein
MKTKKQLLKWLLLLILFAGATEVWAQVPWPGAQTGDMSVCLSSIEPYGVTPNAGSVYTWNILPGTGGAGIITNGAAPNNLVSIQWTSIGTCTLEVTEQNSAGCFGVINSIIITVLPVPLVTNMTASVCSNIAIGVNLPSASTNGLTITAYDITAVVAPGLTGTATTGTGLTGVGVISGDVFGNTTGGDLTVVYTVIPYAGTCAGPSFTVTVTVTPGPTVTNMTASVCSNIAIGVNLPSASTNGLTITAYDITAVVAPGLTGTATTGTGLTGVGVISGDVFGNPTAGNLTVVYTITPYAGTCAGPAFTVIVTIRPDIATSPIYHD